MSTLVLDACLYNLHQVDLLMEGYQEVGSYEAIFESEDPEVKETLVKNKKIEGGVGEHLKKAAEAVLQMIHKFIDFFKNIFGTVGMSKEEKDLYNQFKEACKKDPSLKNKQVTVKDFRETMKQYDALKKEVEQAERDLRAGKETDTDQLINKIKSFAAGAGKGIAMTVGLEAAVNIATTSDDWSKAMYMAVKNDDGPIMQSIIDNVGKKNAKDFQKTTKALGKRISLRRSWMKAKGQICENTNEAIKKTFSDLQTFSGIKKTFKKAQGNEEVKQLTKEIIGDAASSAAKAAGMASKVAVNKATEKPKAFIDSKRVERKLKNNDMRGQSIMDSIKGGDSYKNKLNARLQRDKEIMGKTKGESLSDKMQREAEARKAEKEAKKQQREAKKNK